MSVNEESKIGRPLSRERDATMRYIARKNLFEAVALQCGITAVAVRAWRRVPTQRVRDVECAIGRPRSQIRPDIYRRNPPNSARSA